MTRVWEDPRVAVGLPTMLEARRQALESGATAVGWKVGFGAPASLELMKIEAPVMGYMTDKTIVPTGSQISLDGWTRPVVEFEVAAYIGSDLGPGATPDEARAAVSALGPAIELADIDLPIEPESVSDIVAGNIFHKAVILGVPDPSRAGIDISGLTARIVVDGDERWTVTELEELTGAYPDVVATVADTLASAGELLRAGDLIIMGSVIPPVPGGDGTVFAFALEPLAEITIRCA